MGQFEKTLMWNDGWNTSLPRHETWERRRASGLQYVPGYWRIWRNWGFRGSLSLKVLASRSSRSAKVKFRVFFFKDADQMNSKGGGPTASALR
jgi:hypothetical protein